MSLAIFYANTISHFINSFINSFIHSSSYKNIQESFIKSELQKVETGLQMTVVDGANVHYLHSASLNLLTKAEQILTYYLNEKGYEVLSSLGKSMTANNSLRLRLSVGSYPYWGHNPQSWSYKEKRWIPQSNLTADSQKTRRKKTRRC